MSVTALNNFLFLHISAALNGDAVRTPPAHSLLPHDAFNTLPCDYVERNLQIRALGQSHYCIINPMLTGIERIGLRFQASYHAFMARFMGDAGLSNNMLNGSVHALKAGAHFQRLSQAEKAHLCNKQAIAQLELFISRSSDPETSYYEELIARRNLGALMLYTSNTENVPCLQRALTHHDAIHSIQHFHYKEHAMDPKIIASYCCPQAMRAKAVIFGKAKTLEHLGDWRLDEACTHNDQQEEIMSHAHHFWLQAARVYARIAENKIEGFFFTPREREEAQEANNNVIAKINTYRKLYLLSAPIATDWRSPKQIPIITSDEDPPEMAKRH
ncbi:MAG: hypothetical protein ABII18_11480 [bacterium]|nr:hypothetical protein [bacterium]MBU1918758.1 hypothetical protein [bacterium]